MRILISQMKPCLGNIEKNLEKIVKNIKEGIEKECNVVVFPELALNGTLLYDIVYETYTSSVSEELLRLSEKITIVFGAVEEESGKLYNSGFILEDGVVLGKHRKVFLSNANGVCESRYFTRGKEIKTYQSKHGKLGIALGEEGLNPFVNGIFAKNGVEIVFNLVNLSISDNIELYEGAALANAHYNKNFNVTVNRVGVEDGVTFIGNSFVASPFGKIIEKNEKFNEELSIIEVSVKNIRKVIFKSSFDKEENLDVIRKELEKI